ncbi:MAG: hypothetical protein KDE27_07730 [Planctomycetes bacterium]|nr:hypothetical protein [Planctomycetota bacterium]
MRTVSLYRWVWLGLGFVALGLLASACGGPLERVDLAQQPAQTGPAPQLLTVTLRGKLGDQEMAHATRTLREAAANGVGWVVFVLDEDAGTFTEDPEDLQSLFDRIQSSGVETVTLVKGRATHGAAYLALLTDRTYFGRGAEMGEITKPEPDWGDLFAADPDSEMARRIDGIRSALLDRLGQRKTKLRPEAAKMALAMADPRMQLYRAIVRESGIERVRILEEGEITALAGAGAKIVDQQPLTRPLFVDAATAEEVGLSAGTVDSLEHLARDVLLVDPDAVGELTLNWAEGMIAWLELLSPFLLVAGFLLILIEVKTPGFGLPGVLGAAFLGLSMFYSYLVGLAEVTEIILFFLGLAALAVEIFLLPGTLIFGAVGFLCLVLSLVLSRQSFVLPSNAVEEDILLANLVNLTLLFVLVMVLGALLWRLLPNVPLFNRVFLPPPNPDAPTTGAPSGLGLADERLTALVGRTGVAATTLRPTGAMTIDGDRVDVVTEGDFLEAGTNVRVIYVRGNRVVVGPVDPTGDTAGRVGGGEAGSAGIVFLLAIVGLVLLIAEVFFVSFGVIAVLSGVSLISAVFFAFQEATSFGITMLVVEAVLAPVVLATAFKILPKTPFGRRLILTGPVIEGRAGAADPGLSGLMAKTGVTLSALRPAGFARIDGRKVDVVTRGEMIEANREIVVLDVSANRVVVAERK